MKKMTTLQLNAQIWRDMGKLADSETMMKRVAKYLRKLVAEKEADPTLLTKEEFLARIDKAEKQIEQGACTTFDNVEDMNNWLNAL